MRLPCLLSPLLLLAAGAFAADAVTAPDPAPVPVPAYFTFTFENDFFFDSDDGYSNGFQFAWARGPFRDFGGSNTTKLTAFLAPPWIEAGGDAFKRAVTHRLGNRMVTPDDLEATVPPPDDVSYSGLTYWRTDWMRGDARIVDRAWGTVGIVGPSSGTEEVQKGIHELIGATEPMGWDTQLEDEAVFELGVVRDWRTFVTGSEARGTDLVFITSANIGNLTTRADAGAVFRFGRHLARSFPAVSVLPGREVTPVAGASVDTAHVFVGAMYRYEAWDIALDGNTGEPESSTVTREPNQFYASLGGGWNWGELGFLFSLAKSTKRFEEADTGDWFGSLGITWRYR